MTQWQWKGRDGSRGGLLYEPGNWGDLLKMAWLAAVVSWKQQNDALTSYFDPFAGAPEYPVADAARRRFERMALPCKEAVEHGYLSRERWPSSASLAALMAGMNSVTVFDADPGRYAEWQKTAATVCSGTSGWEVMAGHQPEPGSLWLIDPYDFLEEWRQWLPAVCEKAGTATVLVYIYNRSAGKQERFRDYRSFRNRLDDLRDPASRRIGRVPSDGFLPKAHHEMLLLPGAPDLMRNGIGSLFAELERQTKIVHGMVTGTAVFE